MRPRCKHLQNHCCEAREWTCRLFQIACWPSILPTDAEIRRCETCEAWEQAPEPPPKPKKPPPPPQPHPRITCRHRGPQRRCCDLLWICRIHTNCTLPGTATISDVQSCEDCPDWLPGEIDTPHL